MITRLLFVGLLIGIDGVLAELTKEECLELGFIKPDLKCGSCKLLDQFDLQEIKQDCEACCEPEPEEENVKRYPKAVLEVCTCKFGAYPQIQAFVKSDRPKKFPNLTIKYVRGLDPIIKLIDRDDIVQETLSINKWNTDAVQEFFETVLEEAS